MRHDDWKQRLIVYVDSARRGPVTHCVYFAVRAAEEMTGRALVPDWATGNKARDFVHLHNRGFDTPVDFMATLWLETNKPQVGDVVVMQPERDDEPMIGVLRGRDVYVMSDAGLTLQPRSKITKAFAI